VTWLGGSAAIFAGAFAVLTYFGVNQLIQSSVSEQIKKELDKQDAAIHSATEKIFENVGKIQRDQDQLNSLLLVSNTKMGQMTKDID
jgi:hypothetical protein